jgi:type IX secretion system PorP/SprF family membrane protein
MRKLLKLGLLASFALTYSSMAKAQVDPHFTQYYVYPSWTNPALTGAFDGAYRVSGIYRTQWGNVSTPYNTQGATAEFTTDKNLNLGVSLLNQTAGDGGYRYTTGYGSLAYTGLRLGAKEQHRVQLGMQVGVIQRRFDRTKLKFGDQWNPITGFNPSNVSADVFERNSSTSFDVGAGILYFNSSPDTKANFYGGYSAAHLTKPTDVFSGTGNADLPMRHTVHAGMRIKVNPTLSITPNALYLKQGTATEKMLGVFASLKAAEETDFLFGGNYRFDDAVTPFAGFSHKGFVVGLSYDVNVSDLGRVANGSNSFELSLSFIGKKKVRTPEVDFVCPRL